MVLGDGTDADVVAFAEDPLEAAVQVFHVRDGRVRGQRGWVVEKVEDLTTGDLVHHFCTQVYGDEHGEGDVPRELLVPALPPDADGAGRVAVASTAAAGCSCGCRSAATSGRCWRRWPATPARRWPGTSCAAPAT